MLNIFFSNAKVQSREYPILLLAILASLISSYIALAYHQPFNVDGIIYLNSAAAYLQGNVIAAFDVYHWPFYSILIALAGKITHLPLELAAFALNTSLNTLTFLTFIVLIKELGGSKRVQFFALLIIIAYPFLNHARDNILRDFGYYAFGLLSLLFFIRYMRHLDWKNSLGWGLSIIFTTLFRIEGVLFLILIPLLLFFHPILSFKEKLSAWLKLNSLNIAGFILAVLLLFASMLYKHSIHIGHVNQLQEYFSQYDFNNLTYYLKDKNTSLQQMYLKITGENAPTGFIIGSMLGVFFESFLNAVSLFYLFLCLYSLSNRLVSFKQYSAVGWSGYLLLNLFIGLIFVFSNLFIAERYLGFLCLILLLSAPFALDSIYQQWQQRKNTPIKTNWFFPLICLLMLLTSIDSFGHFGTSKAYITAAGAWIDHNTRIDDKILSNNAQLLYYGHRNQQVDGIFTTDALHALQQNLAAYNYVALVLYKDQLSQEKTISEFLKTPATKSFQNRRGDKVLIFTLNKK